MVGRSICDWCFGFVANASLFQGIIMLPVCDDVVASAQQEESVGARVHLNLLLVTSILLLFTLKDTWEQLTS